MRYAVHCAKRLYLLIVVMVLVCGVLVIARPAWARFATIESTDPQHPEATQTGSAEAQDGQSETAVSDPTAAEAFPNRDSKTDATSVQENRNEANNAQKDKINALVIMLRPFGFDPKEVSLSKGQFILAVTNRSAIDDIDLQLLRENDNGKLHESKLSKGKSNWKQMVDLPPGRYLLTESDHPEWQCRINISPK